MIVDQAKILNPKRFQFALVGKVFDRADEIPFTRAIRAHSHGFKMQIIIKGSHFQSQNQGFFSPLVTSVLWFQKSLSRERI